MKDTAMANDVSIPPQPEREQLKKPGISRSTWLVCLVVGLIWAAGAGLLALSLRPYQAVKERVKAPLKGASLAGAHLESAVLPGRDLSHTNLHAADLLGADLHGANLDGANLTKATLDDADMRDANLNGANLRGASLLMANLKHANLHGTDLRGTNLQAEYLQGVNLTGALYDQNTLWPQHYDPKLYGAIFASEPGPGVKARRR